MLPELNRVRIYIPYKSDFESIDTKYIILSAFPTYCINIKVRKIERKGSREEDEVSDFFVLSHLWMMGYFILG